MSMRQNPGDGPNFQQSPESSNVYSTNGSHIAVPLNPNVIPQGARLRCATQPPPLPPRPQAILSSNSSSFYGGMPSLMSPMYGDGIYGGGYGAGAYPPRYPRYANGGYGSYGAGYGGFGYGGGRYGAAYGSYNGANVDHSLSNAAEASVRPAFESIDSFVQTFGSVSMMLDSTLGAMYATFRAFVGVAENFQRLRRMIWHFAQYMSAFALLRLIYRFYRQILHMLGLVRGGNPTGEAIWKAAEDTINGRSSGDQAIGRRTSSSWPIAAFFGLLFGGPYLMYKLFMSSKTGSENTPAVRSWDPKRDSCENVIAVHSFAGASAQELSFGPGEYLGIPRVEHRTPENMSNGWSVAVNRQGQIGWIPLNRIRKLQKSVTTGMVPTAVMRHMAAAKRNSTGSVAIPENIPEEVAAVSGPEMAPPPIYRSMSVDATDTVGVEQLGNQRASDDKGNSPPLTEREKHPPAARSPADPKN